MVSEWLGKTEMCHYDHNLFLGQKELAFLNVYYPGHKTTYRSSMKNGKSYD